MSEDPVPLPIKGGNESDEKPEVSSKAHCPESVANKTQVQNKKNIQEKESFQRINFLFQAAHVVAARSPRARSISTYYGSLLNTITQKALIRMHPHLKRQLCRGCRGLLLPGITAYVKVKSRPRCQVVWTCDTCMTIRRIPAKRDHQLWIEKPEAIASIHQ